MDGDLGWFRDPNVALPFGTVSTTHRKFVTYNTIAGDNSDVSGGHGTHVVRFIFSLLFFHSTNRSIHSFIPCCLLFLCSSCNLSFVPSLILFLSSHLLLFLLLYLSLLLFRPLFRVAPLLVMSCVPSPSFSSIFFWLLSIFDHHRFCLFFFFLLLSSTSFFHLFSVARLQVMSYVPPPSFSPLSYWNGQAPKAKLAFFDFATSSVS